MSFMYVIHMHTYYIIYIYIYIYIYISWRFHSAPAKVVDRAQYFGLVSCVES